MCDDPGRLFAAMQEQARQTLLGHLSSCASPQEVSMLLWGIATLLNIDDVSSQTVAAAFEACARSIGQMQPQGVANCIWSLSKLCNNGLADGAADKANWQQLLSAIHQVLGIAHSLKGGSWRPASAPNAVVRSMTCQGIALGWSPINWGIII